jgi:hypothetical protein
MAETMRCPGCGAETTDPVGPRRYRGVTGYEYVTFRCGWHGTRARDNGQFAYTGQVRICPPEGVSQESLRLHGWE